MVIADKGEELCVALRTTGGVTSDRPLETAGPTLPDAAVANDEEVVGHIRASLAVVRYEADRRPGCRPVSHPGVSCDAVDVRTGSWSFAEEDPGRR